MTSYVLFPPFRGELISTRYYICNKHRRYFEVIFLIPLVSDWNLALGVTAVLGILLRRGVEEHNCVEGGAVWHLVSSRATCDGCHVSFTTIEKQDRTEQFIWWRCISFIVFPVVDVTLLAHFVYPLTGVSKTIRGSNTCNHAPWGLRWRRPFAKPAQLPLGYYGFEWNLLVLIKVLSVAAI